MRLIDAVAYAEEMKKRQDACKEWIQRTIDNVDEENYLRSCGAYAVFVEAKLLLENQPTIDAEQKRIECLQKLVDINTERCEELRKQLMEAHESYEKHLNELEAQFPKHGEWIESDDFDELIKGSVVCSNCGEKYQSLIMRNKEIELRANKTPYCPNCGAKMDGEVKSDALDR